ncbi:hypothetical protein QJQ45_001867 [Haematococcus lacustris]|nr:hypothetical protein QJQ45_001867 [Haematococcus lacustris]
MCPNCRPWLATLAAWRGCEDSLKCLRQRYIAIMTNYCAERQYTCNLMGAHAIEALAVPAGAPPQRQQQLAAASTSRKREAPAANKSRAAKQAQDPPPPPPAQKPPPPAQDQPPAQAPPGPVPRPQAPSWGRWLDRDTNPCLNFQRIGEIMQRPLELCSYEGLMALPPVGKEYQQGYKRINDRLPKVKQRLHRAAEYRRGIDGRARNNA